MISVWLLQFIWIVLSCCFFQSAVLVKCIFTRAVASGPAGPTLVGPLFGSKMRACLDDSYDSYARAHALTVAAVFLSVDRGMDSSFTEITTQKFADIPERPLSL